VNRFSRHELFGSSGHPVVPAERPVQSDYVVREPNYARRRLITIVVLAVLIGGGVYAFWPDTPPDPADIPTIAAEENYKQKPADPGGIDIPHQDVRVYDQLEGKGTAAPVEHLLPPPETPKEEVKEAIKEVPKEALKSEPASVVAEAPQQTKTDILKTATPAKPVETTVEKAVEKPVEKAVEKVQQSSAVETAPAVAEAPKEPVAAAPAMAPEKPKAEPLSMEKVIEKVNAGAGNVVAQLASSSNEAQARALMEKLQEKYAVQFGSTKLRLTRADLGARGIFYRIQTEPLARDEAGRLCSSLKKLNAGCIIVGK